MGRVSRIVAGGIAAAALAACSASGPGGADTVAVVEVVDDVAYYYACGDEVLTLPDGRQFFPLEDQTAVDTARYDPGGPEARAVAAVEALTLAVAPPRPGDDVGTLTIHEDGMARFMSNLGTVAWLDDQPRTYPWVC